MANLNFNKMFVSNELGIPILDINKQAGTIELPVDIYGRNARQKMKAKTVLFYTGDYRFSALLNEPEKLVKQGVETAGEPNYTIHANMPYALALFQIYKKRYVARYLQDLGVKILVDLNVPLNYKDLNKQGIPEGWNAFVTRGYFDVDIVEYNFDAAKEISGLDRPNMIVYGGSKEVRTFCEKNALLWFSDVNKNI